MRLAFERDDPYSRIDADNAALMGAILWSFGGFVCALLLPFARPTAAIGWPGWIPAVAIVVGCFCMARRRLSDEADYRFTETFIAGLGSLAAIALIEWLAGGRHSPYHYLYALPVVYSAAVHSRRRALISVLATILAVCLPLIYQGDQHSVVRDVVAQVAILLALGLAARVLTMTIALQREALHHARRTAERLARQDPLTGLANRRAFEEALEHEVARARRLRAPLSVALCDVDGFKELNDRFGHLHGDTVLQEVAGLLSATARASDECFRWGGDEFAIVLPGTNRANAERFCGRLRNSAVNGDEESVTLTFGIAELAPGEGPRELVRAADEALLSRKRREPVMPPAGNTSDATLVEPAQPSGGEPARLDATPPRRRLTEELWFSAAGVLLGITLVYLTVLVLAGASVGIALPAFALPVAAAVIALRGWENDRRAALAASEAEARSRLQARRLQERLVGLHREELASDPDDVGSLVLRAAMGVLEVERGALLSATGDGSLQASTLVGFEADPLELPPLSDLAHKALADDEAAWSNGLSGTPVRNAVAIPVYVQDEVLGIVLCADRGAGFGEPERDVLLAIGDHAGAVLNNSRLRGELRGSYLATVRMLVDAIAIKDAGLGGHSVEVSRYVARVGERLDLDATHRERLYFASMLHDVGKLGISEQILMKPGPLTAHEREIIELHPRIGASLVRQVPSLRGLGDAVLHHHERFDGTGYPDGLAGEEIPLDARIIAVVDAYSAMITDRPYRSRMSLEEACVELEASAGSQFDPEVVRVFVEEVRSGPQPLASRPLEIALDDPEVAVARSSEHDLLGAEEPVG